MKSFFTLISTTILVFLLAFPGFVMCVKAQDVNIKVITTSDLHAAFFPWDFTRNTPVQGSLAHVKAYTDQQRAVDGQQVILLDNADLIQGQPTSYYFNFVAPREPHFIAEVMNYTGFDAASVGNHDVEMGHEVFNQLNREFDFPWLAANILHVRTGRPYFKPYTIIEREGVKVAVIGLVTPSVPNWLPRKLWEGLEFVSMYSAASYWMNHIQEKEKPDAVIGLFHSGKGPNIDYQGDEIYLENAALYVGRYVPGFDVIFTAHDHRERNETFVNAQNEEVLMLGGRPYGNSVAVADLHFSRNSNNEFVLQRKEASLVSMAGYEPCPAFMQKFEDDMQRVFDFVDKPLGVLENPMSTRDSYFGNSSFTDFIHFLQMQLSDADVSFAAPLSFDATLAADTLFMRDMFQLYPFENYLYVMELTGREIIDFLEYSYGLWLNTMEDASDPLLLFRMDEQGNPITDGRGRARFQHAFFNFDSAMGLDYTVDVSKPAGSRVTVKSLAGGKTFDKEQKYRVAINSYRGSGGGGHLTEGAGIAHELLESRIQWVSDHDLRSHIAAYIESRRQFAPQPAGNWKIIPEAWVEDAAKRDRNLLFGAQE